MALACMKSKSHIPARPVLSAKREKSIFPTVCVPVWVQGASGRSWSAKYLRQGAARRLQTLERTNEADVSTDCVSKK